MRGLKTFILAAALIAGGQVCAADITVSDVWVRETPGPARVTAGYAHIANAGAAEKILSVTTPAAGMAEMHETADQGGMMRMEAVPALDVPAHGAVDFKPGGYHIMIMNLNHPLKVGDTIDITFTLEHAGKITVPAKVAPLAATKAP